MKSLTGRATTPRHRGIAPGRARLVTSYTLRDATICSPGPTADVPGLVARAVRAAETGDRPVHEHVETTVALDPMRGVAFDDGTQRHGLLDHGSRSACDTLSNALRRIRRVGGSAWIEVFNGPRTWFVADLPSLPEVAA